MADWETLLRWQVIGLLKNDGYFWLQFTEKVLHNLKIVHHVNVHSSSAEFYSYIIRSGIQYAISDYPGNDNKLLSFDISETTCCSLPAAGRSLGH